ncbi:hypothetical protein OAK75_01725 [Bacteriovoracales bacterium]|nr:hypothetical protein [Bacteriovoracales bacterium]
MTHQRKSLTLTTFLGTIAIGRNNLKILGLLRRPQVALKHPSSI